MSSQARILVIDDDETIAELICDVLSFEGCSVEAVTDPVQALQLLTQGVFDLVILDLGMPLLGGVEVIQRIRADPHTQRIPIIVVSAFPELQRRVPPDTVSAVISKPFTIQRLAHEVIRVLNRDGWNPDPSRLHGM